MRRIIVRHLRRGIASHVLERRSAFHEEGAGIQIGPNGTRILKLLKVAEALRPTSARRKPSACATARAAMSWRGFPWALDRGASRRALLGRA